MSRDVGQRVVITGAGSGIGRATALRYAKRRAAVIALDIDEAAAKATAEMCRADSADAFAYQCDVADAKAVDELANQIEADHGPVDVLVNNAGVGVAGPFLDGSLDDWTWIRSINLDGVVHGCRSFGRAMVARGSGQIVNVASGNGYLPSRRLGTYCTTKAAVIMLSRCLRADLARSGVGVSVVNPGVTNTPILQRGRLRGDAVGRDAAFARVFSMGHSPDTMAKGIVRAADRNQAFVAVGMENKMSYHMLRLFPFLNNLVARF